VNRKYLVIVFIVFIIGFSMGLKGFNQGRSLNSVKSSMSKNNFGIEGRHPYGNPVKGPLMWEFDEKVLETLAGYNADIRMAAFKAKLPDPLPGEKDNIAHAADLLRGTVIKQGEIFSMNRSIGPYTKRRGFKSGPTYVGTRVVQTEGGGVCKIASLLYNVAVLADLKIVERNSHGMLVPYVPPGQDATVSYGAKDFKFKNNTSGSLVIWSDTKGDTLYMGLYGSQKPPKVKWHHKILGREKHRTIYRNNSKLKPGEKRVKISGSDALTVKSWLTIEYSDGKKKIKKLGVDYYRAMPRIVERGRE